MLDMPPEEVCPAGRVTSELCTKWPSKRGMQLRIERLNVHKALGPDRIGAKLLQAGGDVIVDQPHHVACSAVQSGHYPGPWRGGRIANVFKKGDEADTDAWRGIQVNSHASKVLASWIYDRIAEDYLLLVGSCQFGAVPKLGTALASHILRSAMEASRRAGFSALTLFIDLSKAFDWYGRLQLDGWMAT